MSMLDTEDAFPSSPSTCIFQSTVLTLRHANDIVQIDLGQIPLVLVGLASGPEDVVFMQFDLLGGLLEHSRFTFAFASK